MKNYILHIGIGLLIYSTISAQELSIQQMGEDIEYYLRTIDEKHPDLYRNYASKQFDSVKQIVLSACQQPMSSKDFNRILLKFNYLTDGHTTILPTCIPNPQNKTPFFPYFQIKNDSVWIKDKLLLTVNNFDPTALILEMIANQGWEYHPKTRELFVNEHLPSFLFTFHQITPPYTLQLKDTQTGTVTEVNIEIKYPSTFKYPIESKFYPEESIAVIHYKICDFANTERLTTIALEQIFNEVNNKKIEYLFIDVTKNEGGNDYYNEFIFKYLKSKKINMRHYRKVNIKEVDSIIIMHKKHHLDQLKKCGNNIFRRIKTKNAIKKTEKIYKNSPQTGIITSDQFTIPGNRKGFRGKVFVLQSRQTYSAAVGFCEAIRRQQMGIIVGEEPGQPIDFCGNVEDLELPHSKIKFCFASHCSWYEPPIPTREGFIVPDIPYDVFDESPDMNHHKLNIEDYKKIIQLSTHLK